MSKQRRNITESNQFFNNVVFTEESYLPAVNIITNKSSNQWKPSSERHNCEFQESWVQMQQTEISPVVQFILGSIVNEVPKASQALCGTLQSLHICQSYDVGAQYKTFYATLATIAWGILIHEILELLVISQKLQQFKPLFLQWNYLETEKNMYMALLNVAPCDKVLDMQWKSQFWVEHEWNVCGGVLDIRLPSRDIGTWNKKEQPSSFIKVLVPSYYLDSQNWIIPFSQKN